MILRCPALIAEVSREGPIHAPVVYAPAIVSPGGLLAHQTPQVLADIVRAVGVPLQPSLVIGGVGVDVELERPRPVIILIPQADNAAFLDDHGLGRGIVSGGRNGRRQKDQDAEKTGHTVALVLGVHDLNSFPSHLFRGFCFACSVSIFASSLKCSVRTSPTNGD